MLFVVVSGPDLRGAEETIENNRHHADGFEFRLDLISGLSFMSLKRLMELASKPVMFTLRLNGSGGSFEEAERKVYLREYLELLPDFLDLEHDSDPEFAREISLRYPRMQIICSYHNYRETPPQLESIFTDMLDFPAVIFKIATQAHSTLDALRIMQFVQEKSKEGHQIIGIGMGPRGEMTRILGPVFGNHFTYAGLPGEISAEILCERYHHKSLTPSTQIYGLIGDPVEQSPSDITHNRFLKQLDFSSVYLKMVVKRSEVSHFLELVQQFPFRGLSVTVPLKEEVSFYVEESDLDSSRIDAFNTLIFQENKTIRGANTDGCGALDALEKHGPVKGKKILLLGAGGSARGIAYEAVKRGAELTILNRTEQRAKDLAALFNCQGFGMTYLEEICSSQGYDILINATSVGMAKEKQEMPISSEFIFPNTIVMDIIISQNKTLLLEEALKKNCKIVTGEEMFLKQAMGQFSLWLDHSGKELLLQR